MSMSQSALTFHDNLPPSGILSVASQMQGPFGTVMANLDTALKVWDDDRIEAKAQIRVAVATLRGYSAEIEAPRDAGSTQRRGLAPWQARKVAQFIDTSLDASIRLNDCAARARLSASYFSHAFKATFGMTVGQYIRRRRIERAQQLMLRSGEPLSQIALACGFADQSHYCRVFRSVVGASPDAWRRRNRLVPNDL